MIVAHEIYFVLFCNKPVEFHTNSTDKCHVSNWVFYWVTGFTHGGFFRARFICNRSYFTRVSLILDMTHVALNKRSQDDDDDEVY